MTTKLNVRIDFNKAVELLTKVVEKRGTNFIYAQPNGITCKYWHDGKPSCGLGQLFFDLGVKPQTLAFMDSRTDSNFDDELIQRDLNDIGITFTEDAFKALTAFQVQQDNGHNYGHALEQAKRGNNDPYPRNIPPF